MDPSSLEFHTLSLHDALPILWPGYGENSRVLKWIFDRCNGTAHAVETPIGRLPKPEDLDVSGLNISPDRKSTRLNSSHANISYAVFCLKKKKGTSSLRAS